MTNGEIIKRRRLELGISQADLAARVPCTTMALSRIETGITARPNRAVAAGLARELGLDADALRPPDPDARARAFAGARRRQEAALVA